MKRFLMRFFPIRAKSVDEFVDLVRTAGCGTVQITPVERNIGMPGPAGCSLFVWVPAGNECIGTERYVLYSARTPQGREIRHYCERTVRYEEAGVLRDHVAHEQDAARVFFEAERQAQWLRRMLPGVVVEECSITGIPITAATRREYHRIAAEYGVTPPTGHV